MIEAMKPSSLKITSDHILLCFVLSLLWGVTDSTTTATITTDTTLTTTTEAKPTTVPLTSLKPTKPSPGNVNHVNVSAQNENNITLMWDKVENISTYFLKYDNGDGLKEDFINATKDGPSVTFVVSSLTAGRKYNLTLITVFEGVNSTGYSFPAATAPPNANNLKSVDQTETSITLRWTKVGNILNYILVLSGEEKNITASEGNEVTGTISGLKNMTQYDITLLTVFYNAKSSGVNTTAFTAPPNANNFKSVGQNETSITLQWMKVGDIRNYILVFNGEKRPVAASGDLVQVKHTILELTSGTKYDFTLYTVFKNITSIGVNSSAATAPGNVNNVTVFARNETSITLMWDKVNHISVYFVKYDDKEEKINASHQPATVTHEVSSLTAGRKYEFTVITWFEGVNSTGRRFEAVTAPRNTEGVETAGQNETSITLQWIKVEDILNYTIVFNETVKNFIASEGQGKMTYTISELTSGTKYDFSLYTVFDDIRSSGVNHSAATAPRNTEVVYTVGQNETSITLQWVKVEDILNYTLVFNETVLNFTASEGQGNVTYTISELTSGTKYDFSVYTVFDDIRSSGVNHSAATAPQNVNKVTVLTQNESSVTLKWDMVGNIPTYFLQYDNGRGSIMINGDASITHEVSSLNAGTKYNFTLITSFENINSTGLSFNAVTVPSMVASVSVTERSLTSVRLTWQKVKNDWDYFLHINGTQSRQSPNRAIDVVSYSITSLKPGTEYPFRVITMFSGFNSTAYEDFILTTIDCSNATWRITNSSIHGMIEGLFSSATATNKSQCRVSHGGSNVTFDGLYPGATYEVSLVYEKNNHSFDQCNHTLTIIPPYLTASCDYLAAGYSVLIVWSKPEGVWTSVEVNVNGKKYPLAEYGQQSLEISGFQPAKTYEVSVASLSGKTSSSEPFVFSCLTDPRGVIAGSVLAVLLFGVLVCLAVFIWFKRPLSKKNRFIGGSSKSNKRCKPIPVERFPGHFNQLGVDENRGFSDEYESLVPVGTEQTRKSALLPENKARNRFNNVLPYDWSRVKLTTSNPNGTSDYINACHMPGYNSSREYIATQGPLPSTVDDFWKMVWEQRVKGIVMVTNCTEGGKTKCEQYWPADSKPCSYGELSVTIRSQQQEPDWTLREFSVKHRNNSEERTVKHFHFTAWPDHGVPQGAKVLIQFRGLVRQHIDREGAGAPTVVHCSAGVGRTGTIIALDVLLQQLDRERTVGINDFVYKMRLSRPHMVQTESQYVFLHQCIMECLQPNEKTEENIYENSDMIYANATALRDLTNA